jgi:hypothetical protein
MPEIALVCLGTGVGYTHVYDGECSAAYALTVDAKPVLLIGCGGGVVRQCRRLLGAVPTELFVHNNRTSSAGELPVLLGYEAAQGRRVHVYAAAGVAQRLIACRLAELHDHMRASSRTVDDLCEFVPLCEGAAGQPLRACPDLSLAVRRAPQSELSYALLVLYRGKPLLAVSGDAGADEEFYSDLGHAPTVAVDGRKAGSADHAGVDQLAASAALSKSTCVKILVGGYGRKGDEGGNAFDGGGKFAMAQPGSVEVLVCDDAGGEPALPIQQQQQHDEKRSVLFESQRAVAAEPMRRSVSDSTTDGGRRSGSRVSPTRHASALWALQQRDLIDDHDEDRDRGDHMRGQRAAMVYRNDRPAAAQQPRAATTPISAHSRQRSDQSGRASVSQSQLQSLSRPSSAISSPRASPRVSSTAPGVAPCKVWLFSNEDRHAPAVSLMVQQLRTVAQLHDKASRLLNLRPLEAIYLPDGTRVSALAQLQHNGTAVVTKLGGAKFAPLVPAAEVQRRLHRLAKGIHDLPDRQSFSISVDEITLSRSPGTSSPLP